MVSDLRSIDPLSGHSSIATDAASAGPAPQLAWLPIASLRVDPTYQRPVTGHGRVNIAKIVAEFRWNRFAPIVVSPIAGGLYAVVDGQHRATAAATIGFESVPAQIILADVTEQAAAFSAINGAVTRIHGQALHKAAVAAGDPTACRIERVAASAGVKVLAYPVAELNQEPGETMAIGALRDAIDTYGEETVRVALAAIRKGQNDVRGGLTAVIIRGAVAITAMMLAHGRSEFDIDEFIGSVLLIREADKARIAERPKGKSIAAELIDRLKAALGAWQRGKVARHG